MRRMRKELLMLLTLTLSFTLVDSHRVKSANICENIKVSKQKCNVNDNHMFFKNYEGGGGGTYVSVTDIDVGSDELHLKLNETYSVNVSYYPENCSYSLRYCDFKTDNDEIATVNTSGVVEPHCYGSTTIYVYLRSNHDIYKTINVFVDSEMEEYYNDIEYNHFDDSIEVNGDLIDNTNCDLFEKVGSNDLINYSCSFNLENNEVYFNASLKAINKISVSFKIDVEIAEDKNGFVDAAVLINGKKYMLNDYIGNFLDYDYSTNDSDYFQDKKDMNLIIELALLINIVEIMVVIYVVMNLVTLFKSKENYEYNKTLDNTDKGVKTGNYIYDQSDRWTVTNHGNSFHNPAAYKFGFFEVEEKGCGAVAIYNLLVDMERPIDFSSVIRLLETNNGLIYGGLCGANPLIMIKILGILKIPFKCFITDSAAFTCLDKKENAHIIMCRWNGNELREGAHYFYAKIYGSDYECFNSYSYQDDESLEQHIEEDYGKSIMSYII